MRIGIYGAGAIGGYLGALLAMDGADVTLIARGPHLAAMQKDGLTLLLDGDEHVVRPKLTDDPAEAGAQDYVILTLKAPSMPHVLEPMQHLLTTDTAVVTATNGIPWWYFYRHGGEWDGHRLQSVDPGGLQWNGIGPERAIGCVVYPAAEVVRPGVVRHIEGNRFTLGEPDGEKTHRVMALGETLTAAGLRAPVRPIRDEIWLKLWGNLSFNPISALTHATLVDICQFRETRKLADSMMREAQAIAEKLGVTFRHTIEKRIAGAEGVGAHKTSMLQDVEGGRSLEIEAVVGGVLELGRLTKTPAPSIEAVYACVKLLNRIMVTEGGGVRVAA